jgi:hypothetical protein
MFAVVAIRVLLVREWKPELLMNLPVKHIALHSTGYLDVE